ncbi:hypothetical protein GP486_007253 [Trichoglossum hirsutum]|uniref:Clr5 domain-containing protein n=1 Tax=Trichoglossum hirsutum TaxID=265104 RepID=A0A9P8IFT5_9PEZI|nr:hypothetical protein GP486_007253 [Trichoglossum hirsutum]
MSTIARARANHHTAEEWERYRKIIKRLYIDENKTQNEVRQILEAHESQLKKQLDKWDLAAKNVKLKREEKAALLQLQEGRWALENKTTEFRKWGKQVDPRTLSRFKDYLGKNSVLAGDLVDDSVSLAGVSYRTPSVNGSYIETAVVSESGGWKKPKMVDIIAKYMAGLSIRSEKTRGVVLKESNLHQLDSPTSNTSDRPLPNLPQESEASPNNNSDSDLKNHDSQPFNSSSRRSPTELLFKKYINSDMLLDDSSRPSTSTEASDLAQLPPQPLSSAGLSSVIHEFGSGTADGELTEGELARRFPFGVEEVLSSGFVGGLSRSCVTLALELAVLSNRGDIVHVLLRGGAAPEFQVCYGIWATQWAVMADGEEIMNSLLSAKADPNRVGIRQESLLHMAAERGTDGILRSLISAGASIDARNEDQRTPLHCATRREGNVAIVRELIQAYANVNAADLHGNTPLHFATRFGDAEMIRTLLLSGADPNSRNNLQQTPMFNILDSARDTEIAVLLLEYGAGVNFRTMNGSTPLHLATLVERVDIVVMLLESGADIASQDHFGQTPLYLAIERGNSAIAKLLAERGADMAELGSSTKRATPQNHASADRNSRVRQFGGPRSQLQSISEELNVEDEPMEDGWLAEDIEAADSIYVLYRGEF